MNNEINEGYRTLTRTVGLVFLAKTIVGVVLMILGCIAAFWVLLMIFDMIENPEDLALVQKMSQIGTEGVEIGVMGGKITFPPVVSKYGNIIFSYGLVIIFLAISAGLAKAFLYTGASLVKSDIKPLLEKLGEQLARLWSSEKKEV
jgi:hypothetical protein